MKAAGPERQRVAEGVTELHALRVHAQDSLLVVLERELHERLDLRADLRRHVQVEDADLEGARRFAGGRRVAHAAAHVGKAVDRQSRVDLGRGRGRGLDLRHRALDGLDARAPGTGVRGGEPLLELVDATLQCVQGPQAGLELLLGRAGSTGVFCPGPAAGECAGQCERGLEVEFRQREPRLASVEEFAGPVDGASMQSIDVERSTGLNSLQGRAASVLFDLVDVFQALLRCADRCWCRRNRQRCGEIELECRMRLRVGNPPGRVRVARSRRSRDARLISAGGC